MISLTDPTGNKITFNKYPTKIISLVPSQTELLHYLNLENEVVGITKFCIHPNEWFKTKQRVGGTKNVKFDVIEKLQPDLIVANKEENEESQIKFLQSKYPVYTSEIYNLNDTYKMMQDIGTLTNKAAECSSLIEQIKSKHKEFKSKTHIPIAIETSNKKVAYLIWKEPMLTAGNNTFINSLLEDLGLENVCKTFDGRYPEISVAQIQNLKPDYIFLSSEPFPFKEKELQEFKIKFSNSTPILVDGEMFSWYGNRLLLAFDYFNELLNKLEN